MCITGNFLGSSMLHSFQMPIEDLKFILFGDLTWWLICFFLTLIPYLVFSNSTLLHTKRKEGKMPLFELNRDGTNEREILETLSFLMHLALVMGIASHLSLIFHRDKWWKDYKRSIFPTVLISLQNTFCLCLTLTSKVHPNRGEEFSSWFNCIPVAWAWYVSHFFMHSFCYTFPEF